MGSKKRVEFGDYQSPVELTDKILNLINSVYTSPNIIIEPTCGLGSFIKSCKTKWGISIKYYGFDINPDYIKECNELINETGECDFKVADFFQTRWEDFFHSFGKSKILVIGNPPWVTNAAIGSINGSNLPHKSNFQNLEGFAPK